MTKIVKKIEIKIKKNEYKRHLTSGYKNKQFNNLLQLFKFYILQKINNTDLREFYIDLYLYFYEN